MRRRAVLTLGVLMPSAAHAGWFSDTYAWRQKLTVAVNTPNGLKTGAAVTAISVRVKNGRWSRTATVTGEATLIEVGPGQYLFALLSGQLHYHPDQEHTQDLAALLWSDVLPPPRDRGIEEKFDSRKEWGPLYEAIPRLRGARQMPPELWPALVTFGDVREPQSVRVVTPDRLPEVFGAGVSVQSMSLEITDEPATDGVVPSILPWIEGWKDVLVPSPPKGDSEYSPEERIRGMNFKREG